MILRCVEKSSLDKHSAESTTNTKQSGLGLNSFHVHEETNIGIFFGGWQQECALE
jgi:hypothetical protein